MILNDLREYKLGKNFKFQLASADGRHSTTYSVMTRKSTDDVYVTPMMMGGETKISLHNSGSWQAGLTVEGHARLPSSASRHWEIWKRPNELLPGVTRAWYLLLPGQELRVSSNNTTYKLPPVGSGYAASVEFLFMTEHGPTVDFGEVAMVGQWRLNVSGERLVIVARKVPWEENQRARAKAVMEQVRAMGNAQGVAVTSEHTCFVHGHDDQGVRFGIELAVS